MLLYILLVLLGLLAAACLFVFAAPILYRVDLSWNGSGQPQLTGTASILGLAGLVRFRGEAALDVTTAGLLTTHQEFTLLGRTVSPAKSQSHRASRAHRPGANAKARQRLTTTRPGLSRRLVAATLWPARITTFFGRVAPLVAPTARLIRHVFRHLRPRYAELTGRFGLDDPFATSQVQAFLLTANVPGHFSQWDFQPNFGGSENWGQCILRGRVVVIILLYHVLRYAQNRAVRRELFKLWKRGRSTRRTRQRSAAGNASHTTGIQAGSS